VDLIQAAVVLEQLYEATGNRPAEWLGKLEAAAPVGDDGSAAVVNDALAVHVGLVEADALCAGGSRDV